jgi:hypothetical protein
MERELPEDRGLGRQSELQVRSATVATATADERPLGELVKQLTLDLGELVRKEVALGVAETRQSLGALGRDVAKVGTGVVFAFAGLLALTAFLIAGLGELLNGRYWLSALIIGVIFLAIGGMMARNAVADINRRSLAPARTMNSLREDAAWAKREAGEVKRELTASSE